MSGEFTKKAPITHRRRYSTLSNGSNSSTSPPITNAKPIPNYLKAPVSSCHDLCKYGHHHTSESKWRPPVRPKQRGNCGIRGVVLNPELRVSGKKETLRKQEILKGNISLPQENIFVDKEATFVEDATFDAPRDRIVEMFEEKVFDLSDASSIREITISDEEPSVNSSPVLSRHVSPPLAEESSEDSLSMKVVVSDPDGMHSHALTSDHDLVAEISPSKKESVKMVEMRKNAKVTRINGSESHKGKRGEIIIKKFEREKVNEVSHKTNLTRKRNAVPKDGTVQEPDASIQPIPREKKAMPLINKSRLPNNRTTRPIKCEGEVKVLRPVQQPVLVKPPMKSIRKLKKCTGPTSSLENNPNSSGGSISNAENMKEKTIYMIEAKQEVALGHNQVKKGSYKGKLSSASSSSFSEKDCTGKEKVVSLSQSYPKPPLPPHKMGFRRGKVINVQAETNVPTRIKFRRAKSGNVITRGEGGTGVSKVARKKRVSGSSGITVSTPPTGAQAVLLRHQDSPRDKNGAARSLFNHVIEETASKLAETRKSKVKALVGAFETVISLQENSTVCSSS